MKQIVDKLNKIAKKIDESVEIPQTDLIIDSLDAITKAYGGTPNDSNLIVDKLEDIYNNIGSVPTGNIEITENGENINVAPYATATVNVAGGGTLYHVSGTLANTTSIPVAFYIPALLTREIEGTSYSGVMMSTGTIDNESDPAQLEFDTLIPEADNMSFILRFSLVNDLEITASNEVNCTVSIDGGDVNVLITGDNASFDLTVIPSNNV